jgi:hypothetical protein
VICTISRPSRQNEAEAIVKEGADQELIETIAIAEWEFAHIRSGGFRCIFPTLDRVATHEKLLANHTARDQALQTWIALDEADRAPSEHCCPCVKVEPSHHKWPEKPVLACDKNGSH